MGNFVVRIHNDNVSMMEINFESETHYGVLGSKVSAYGNRDYPKGSLIDLIYPKEGHFKIYDNFEDAEYEYLYLRNKIDSFNKEVREHYESIRNHIFL